MADNHYLKLFTGDYLKDTRHLGVAEHGAYLLLLMQQWDNGPLPDDDAFIARVLRMRIDAWKKIAPTIRAFFSVLPDGRLAQRRLEEERAKIEVIRETRSEVGARGGRAKALKDKAAALANARTLPELSQPFAVPVIATEEDTGSLRSPAAPPAAAEATGVVILLPDQLASAQVGDPPGDLFGAPPALEPERPTAGQILYREGVAKMVEMTGRHPDRIKTWFGKMRKEYGDDPALILEAIQDAHRRWLKRGDDERADPTGWVSGYVKARCRPQGAAAGPVPEFAGADRWRVSDVVDYCGDLMKVGCDGLWPGFSHVIAEALAAGADPDRHVYPVMRDVARKGYRTVTSVGFFRFGIFERLRGTAAA